jgi:hypothetical protein
MNGVFNHDFLVACWDFCKDKDGVLGGTLPDERYAELDKKYRPMLEAAVPGQAPWLKVRGTEFAPNRGIYDYGWRADFGRKLTDQELLEVCGWLHNDDHCPGWTGVHGRELVEDGKVTYYFTTTMDSSD